MALKTFKPYTKSTRGTILVDRTGLWKGKPFKTLVSPKNAMKGRNNNGHITSINRAGGHKKMYRHVDFYRKKFDMSATVERIEYDPNRSCYIMCLNYIFSFSKHLFCFNKWPCACFFKIFFFNHE